MLRRHLPALFLAVCATPGVAATPPCAVDWLTSRVPSSIGDATMRPAMDALLAAFRRGHGGMAPPLVWEHRTDARAIGALIFATADIAPLSRPFAPAELAPYDHQYRGDMMKAPASVRIGTLAGRPATIAFNRRPDSPLPERSRAFLAFALSDAGQAALARVGGFEPLGRADIDGERAKLANGYLPPLDAGLAAYRPSPSIRGPLSSVGSDGMKDLLDGWMCRFTALQPDVRRGERWEHLGTLNGFHALLAGEADLAPMGRELWPQELAAWRSVHGGAGPVEIRVARGGFDTPQRTTAQAIFVHPDNPLRSIGMDQLAALYGERATITRWGQLGLTGAWADRPIRVLMPPRVAPNAMSMQMMMLNGGGWNADAREAPYAQTAKALSDDRYAIAFGGLEEGAPGLRALAVTPRGGGSAIPLDAENAATGRYPFTRFMYVRLAAGQPTPQAVAFLRYVLSREGQERVRYSGYFPLTAVEAAAELARLEAARAAPAR